MTSTAVNGTKAAEAVNAAKAAEAVNGNKAAEVVSPDTTSKDKQHGVLYVGIDLGTSRTSVSASNGVRETLASVVGYPKDVVARKLLKKDVLFGDEALEKRLSLKVYRPLEHGVLKASDGKDADTQANLQAARDLIREAIQRCRPRKDELIYAVIGAPAQASIRNKEVILEAARESVDSVMLCSEPFSVAYGLEMLDDVLVVDIGAGTTDLCRMHGTMPEDSDQVTNTFAGDHIDKELTQRLREKCKGAAFTTQMVKAIKERCSSVADQMEPAIIELPVDGKPVQFDVTEEVRAACRSIVGPIVDGLRKLISTFDPEFQHRLKDRVLLAGGGSMIKGLDSAIAKEMRERLGGGRVIRIEEPMYGGANGALKIAHDMPAEFWEKLK